MRLALMANTAASAGSNPRSRKTLLAGRLALFFIFALQSAGTDFEPARCLLPEYLERAWANRLHALAVRRQEPVLNEMQLEARSPSGFSWEVPQIVEA